MNTQQQTFVYRFTIAMDQPSLFDDTLPEIDYDTMMAILDAPTLVQTTDASCNTSCSVSWTSHPTEPTASVEDRAEPFLNR